MQPIIGFLPTKHAQAFVRLNFDVFIIILDVQLHEMVKKLESTVRFLINTISFKKIEFSGKVRALEARVTALESNPWTLKRTEYTFPGLKTVKLPEDAVTKRTIPNDIIPSNTRAILVSIKCDQWMETFNAKMSLKVKQTGNEDSGSVLYTAPLNDFYYETLVPWDALAGNEITFTTTGGSLNTYTIGIVGYITQ